MKVRKGLIAIAAGAILVTAGAAFSAPHHDYYGADTRYEYGNGEQHERVGEADERLGRENIRAGEQRARVDY
jgi:hypothetical protein